MKQLLVLVLALALPVFADDDERSPLAGHSMHGNAFNEGPRQAAYLMDGMPDISFPVSTTNDLAQKFFNQGVGQLHGFWYFEAERSFRQVAMLDTNCVMAYWGMAMANVNNGKRAREFMTNAVTRTNGLARREVLYIDSLAKFYEVGKKNENKTNSPDADVERHRRYVKSLEQIIEEFPNDLEAKALLAFKIWDNNGRIRISSHMAADALAKQVLDKSPNHPVHHQLIHLWNGEADRRALTAAAHCGQGSPGIAHMWHMPGHTYDALRRYADAAWQQEASARVDHAYMVRNRVLPDQIHNYAHNNEWLVRNLNYLGRVNDALSLSKNLIELPRHPKYNTLLRNRLDTNSPSATNSANYSTRGNNSSTFGRTRLIETLSNWELWDESARLASTMYLEQTDDPQEKAKKSRLLGIAYFRKGDNAKGANELKSLEAVLTEQKRIRQTEMETAESKARQDKKPDDQVTKAMADVINSHSSKIKNIESAIAEVKLYQLLAARDKEAAKKQMEEAKQLSKDRQAQIHFELGDDEKALTLAKDAVKGATNQVRPLAIYVDLLAKAGKKEELTNAFSTLRTVASYADLDTPLLKRLAPVAKSLGFENDWRIEPKPSSDVGTRPALDELGPFRWHPTPAANFVLRDSQNKKVSLADFKGRPVLVIFYLGYGCVHCLEQLNLFAPMAEEYKKAGIEILAISTDSVEGLHKTFEKSADAKGFPFPIVSDEKMETFKAYRAFDDFENMPLHGTFLVDGQGMVRWHDISYEPFTEPIFLLNESKRLLSLSSPPLLTRNSRMPLGKNSKF